jgi:O-antigen ligase
VTLALFVTFSRGAWITFAVMVALWGISMTRVRLVPAIAAVLFIVLAISTLPLIAGEQILSRVKDLSALGRTASQQTAWQIFFDHPALGIGFGSTEFFVQRYNDTFASVSTFNLAPVYNFYLLVLVSTGIIGFALFLCFLLTMVRRLTIAFGIPGQHDTARHLRLGVALGYVSCIGSWLNTPGYNFTFIWFALALVSVLPTIVATEDVSHEVDSPPAAYAHRH